MSPMKNVTSLSDRGRALISSAEQPVTYCLGAFVLPVETSRLQGEYLPIIRKRLLSDLNEITALTDDLSLWNSSAFVVLMKLCTQLVFKK